MFSKKYIFESKSTRFRRLMASGFFLGVVGLVLIISFLSYIPLYAFYQKEKALGAFYQKSPDAIAVFTGDKGRINYALEKIGMNPSAKLFISGVNATNSFKTILKYQKLNSDQRDLELDNNLQVQLDYQSRNTLENVQETMKFIRQNSQFQNVLIISSDYHILRIKLIISNVLKNSQIQYYFDSIPSNYTSWDQLKKLFMESLKIVRTYFILKGSNAENFLTEDY